MVRRIAAIGTPESLALLVEHLGTTADPTAHHTVLTGINQSLKGRRRVTMPAGWPAAFAKLEQSNNGEVRTQALALAVTFGDPAALAEVRQRTGRYHHEPGSAADGPGVARRSERPAAR